MKSMIATHAEKSDYHDAPGVEDNSFSLHNAFKGSGDTLIREGKAFGQTVKGMLDPRTYYHAFTDPATEEEKQVFQEKDIKGAKHIGLGTYRLAVSPLAHAGASAVEIAKSHDPIQGALEAAPEALGTAGGVLVGGKLLGSAGNIAKEAGVRVGALPESTPRAPIAQDIAGNTGVKLGSKVINKVADMAERITPRKAVQAGGVALGEWAGKKMGLGGATGGVAGGVLGHGLADVISEAPDKSIAQSVSERFPKLDSAKARTMNRPDLMTMEEAAWLQKQPGAFERLQAEVGKPLKVAIPGGKTQLFTDYSKSIAPAASPRNLNEGMDARGAADRAAADPRIVKAKETGNQSQIVGGMIDELRAQTGPSRSAAAAEMSDRNLGDRNYNVRGKQMSGSDLSALIDAVKSEQKPGRMAGAAEATEAPSQLAVDRASRTRTPTPEELKKDSTKAEIVDIGKNLKGDISRTGEGSRTAAGSEMNEAKVKGAVERARRTSAPTDGQEFAGQRIHPATTMEPAETAPRPPDISQPRPTEPKQMDLVEKPTGKTGHEPTRQQMSLDLKQSEGGSVRSDKYKLGEKMDQHIPGTPEGDAVREQIRSLTNKGTGGGQLGRLARSMGVDIPEDINIGRAQSSDLSRGQVLDKVLDKGHKWVDIGKAIDEGKHQD
jgi:hypothetical protein